VKQRVFQTRPHKEMYMTGKLVLTAVIGALTGAGLAQQAGSVASTPRPQNTNTLSILNQRVPEITFEELSLEQVMDWLADFTHMNVTVRWQILADAGIDRDKPISVHARNLRLSQVLWLIMSEAAGSEVKLAYRASGNLLVLSTAEDLDKEMVTKIYDVADLLINLPRATRQGAFNVTQGLGQTGQGGTGGGGGGAGGGMFGQGQNQQQQQYGQNNTNNTTDQQIQQLVDLIRQTVEPDSWRENGGQGTIIAYQKSIVVRNTLLVHQRLGGFVNELEAVGP
jgi:hypothetical protein